MSNESPTSPALKTYSVWADRRFFVQVEASSPEEAYREAQKFPGDLEPCSDGIENFEMVPEVMELDSGESFPVGGPQQSELRRASQELYDRIQDYLDVSDEQLIEQGYDGLVQAMDGLEAAWHRADGTKPERLDA